jgi:hypothetical protein
MVAQELVSHIRFPLIKPETFTAEVYLKETGFLTEKEMLQLLAYITAADEKKYYL